MPTSHTVHKQQLLTTKNKPLARDNIVTLSTNATYVRVRGHKYNGVQKHHVHLSLGFLENLIGYLIIYFRINNFLCTYQWFC